MGKEKIYNMKVTATEDGKLNITRNNDGFTAFEILGVLRHSENDVLDQIAGKIKPDLVQRTVVVDEAKQENVTSSAKQSPLMAAKDRGLSPNVTALEYEAHEKGVSDNLAGKALKDNPYAFGSRVDFWAKGWNFAEKSKETLEGRARQRGVTDRGAGKTTFESPYGPGPCSDQWRVGWQETDKALTDEQGQEKKPLPEPGGTHDMEPWKAYPGRLKDFRAGMHAFRDCVPADKNPYPAGSQYEHIWDAGWECMAKIATSYNRGRNNREKHKEYNPSNASNYIGAAYRLGWDEVEFALSHNLTTYNFGMEEAAKMTASAGNPYTMGYWARFWGVPANFNEYMPETPGAALWASGWNRCGYNKRYGLAHTVREMSGEEQDAEETNAKARSQEYYEGYTAFMKDFDADTNPYSLQNCGHPSKFNEISNHEWVQGYISAGGSPLVNAFRKAHGEEFRQLSEEREKAKTAHDPDLPTRTDTTAQGYTAFIKGALSSPQNPFDDVKDPDLYGYWLGGWKEAALALENEKNNVEDSGCEERVISQGVKDYLRERPNPYDMRISPWRYCLWERGYEMASKKYETYRRIAFNKGIEDKQNGISFNPFQDKSQQDGWEKGYASVEYEPDSEDMINSMEEPEDLRQTD
jgi:ribosome modulation factor